MKVIYFTPPHIKIPSPHAGFTHTYNIVSAAFVYKNSVPVLYSNPFKKQ
jgi:hypothetical protein